VYLHYDPYTKRQLGDRPGRLERQRMDFLLLMPRRRRIVLGVDGRRHYADSSGAADPARYSKMMAEDRAVKLAGYEVFRFGAHELTHGDSAALLRAFFRDLLAQHDLSVGAG
jgi:very-short-patch-repair endonuclease